MSLPEPVVSVAGLHKTFRLGFLGRRRIEALKGVDFEVARGMIFGFLGPNGAGKSTTLKILTGLLAPSGGTAMLFGQVPDTQSVRRRYGYLPENPSFHENLTGREILRVMASLLGLDASTASRRTREVLSVAGLDRAADVQVRRYSKGMVQRLGIAQALLHDPELAILDEPMSGLDPVGRREVKELMLDLRARGRTVFFSTHIISDVEELCDQVVILVGGRVTRQGAVRDLIGQGPKQYEVVASGLPTQLPVAPARVMGDRQAFLVPDEEAARRLIEQLWAAGARVHALSVRSYNLEELFLSEVGKGPVGAAVQLD